MGKIEVDEEKLRCFIDASLNNCTDLIYPIFHRRSCSYIKCDDCPFGTVESTIEWLKEEENNNL